MQFRVADQEPQRGHALPNTIYLIRDRWNDYGYVTQFFVLYIDGNRDEHPIGRTKIAQVGMGEDYLQLVIDPAFDELDETYFSLGQDDLYYDNLNQALGSREAVAVVHRALRDIAFDGTIRRDVIGLQVTQTSLLRQVTAETVRNQFHRIATYGDRRVEFAFSYTNTSLIEPGGSNEARLEFSVFPNELPPSNVHALIGANGSGKTRILRDIARLSSGAESEIGGDLRNEGSAADGHLFAATVLVSFSAFDAFAPLTGELRAGPAETHTDAGEPGPEDEPNPANPSYVGLYDQATGQAMGQRALTDDFVGSLIRCNQPERAQRWRTAMTAFTSDEQLTAASRLLNPSEPLSDLIVEAGARALFGKLSSGHKIVLLTIVRLVEQVSERCLVLFDEPETHLHPPLLSALIRAISALMTDRNGVAIIATHSPVVLQEIPRECTWIIRRSGDFARPIRPTFETFGESIGVLTEDVFKLELTESGFHGLLQEAANAGLTYREIVERFQNRLGDEARGIARIIGAEDHGNGERR